MANIAKQDREAINQASNILDILASKALADPALMAAITNAGIHPSQLLGRANALNVTGTRLNCDVQVRRHFDVGSHIEI